MEPTTTGSSNYEAKFEPVVYKGTPPEHTLGGEVKEGLAQTKARFTNFLKGGNSITKSRVGQGPMEAHGKKHTHKKITGPARSTFAQIKAQFKAAPQPLLTPSQGILSSGDSKYDAKFEEVHYKAVYSTDLMKRYQRSNRAQMRAKVTNVVKGGNSITRSRVGQGPMEAHGKRSFTKKVTGKTASTFSGIKASIKGLFSKKTTTHESNPALLTSGDAKYDAKFSEVVYKGTYDEGLYKKDLITDLKGKAENFFGGENSITNSRVGQGPMEAHDNRHFVEKAKAKLRPHAPEHKTGSTIARPEGIPSSGDSTYDSKFEEVLFKGTPPDHTLKDDLKQSLSEFKGQLEEFISGGNSITNSRVGQGPMEAHDSKSLLEKVKTQAEATLEGIKTEVAPAERRQERTENRSRVLPSQTGPTEQPGFETMTHYQG